MPFFLPYSFKVFHTCIPCIKQNEFWIKTTFFALINHIAKMVILRFVVFIDIINSKINRYNAVSYTHLRAHETPEHLVCRLLLEKKKKKKKKKYFYLFFFFFFFNDTATTEIYTILFVGSVRCV